MMGGRRPASGAGSYFNASSNPRVAATGHIFALSTRPHMVLWAFIDHHRHIHVNWHCIGSISSDVEAAWDQLSGRIAIE